MSTVESFKDQPSYLASLKSCCRLLGTPGVEVSQTLDSPFGFVSCIDDLGNGNVNVKNCEFRPTASNGDMGGLSLGQS